MDNQSSNIIVLADFSWMVYRAFYAFKNLEINKNGVRYRTGGLYGTYDGITKILAKYPNATIFLCIDGIPERALREQGDTYKSNRDTEPSDVEEAFPVPTSKILSSCLAIPGVYKAYHESMEADDTIGFLSLTEKGKGNIIIYSTDFDLRQLIDTENGIYASARIDETGFILEDESFVHKKWGVYPRAIPMFKAICGDTSDVVRGIERFPKALGMNIANTFPEINNLKKYLAIPPTTHHQAHYRLKTNSDLIESNYKITKIDPHYIPAIDKSMYDLDEETLRYYECFSMIDGINSLREKRQTIFNDKN